MDVSRTDEQSSESGGTSTPILRSANTSEGQTHLCRIAKCSMFNC